MSMRPYETFMRGWNKVSFLKSLSVCAVEFFPTFKYAAKFMVMRGPWFQNIPPNHTLFYTLTFSFYTFTIMNIFLKRSHSLI